jgi:hypothetical protein
VGQTRGSESQHSADAGVGGGALGLAGRPATRPGLLQLGPLGLAAGRPSPTGSTRSP